MSAPGRWSRLALLLVALAATLAAQGLPLTVINSTTSPASQSPVSFGVPFQQAPNPLYDPEQNGLCVLDDRGQAVPCQFRVLARWNGERHDPTKPLKWVLVSFLADAPANGGGKYYLGIAPRPSRPILATETSSDVVVTTAPGTQFVIDRSALSIFRTVTVAGRTIVPAPGGAVEMWGVGGQVIPPVVTETTLEENGPIRAVVRQKGTLGSLKFTTRSYFHAGRSEVTYDFRLENEGAYGVYFGVTPSPRYFDSCHLRLPVNGAGGQLVSSTAIRNLGGQPYELTQDCTAIGQGDMNIHDNFVYRERVGGTVVQSGERYGGAVEIPGSQGGVTIAVDRFWENFPKSLKLTGAHARVGLWPDWGHGPEYRGQYQSPWTNAPVDPLALQYYRFEGGRWKTSRVVFDFHGGERTPAEVAAAAERANRPLMGRPHPWWTKTSGAVGMLFTDKRTWNEPSMQRYERFAEMLGDDARADDVGGNLGRVGFREFRKRGGTYGGYQWYGWENFGNVWWAEGYSSLHYDWPLSLLLHFYRGGSYELFDVGRDMAWSRRDYNQNHSRDPNETWRGAAFYEKGWWHGSDFFGDEAHTWIHGVLLHYVMTGEEGGYETARETLDYLVRHSPRNWSGYYDARVPGWSISALVDLWNYLGIPAAFNEAQAGLVRFEQLEQQQGGHGWVIDPTSAYPGNPTYGYPPNPAFTQPWMHNIFFIAAARYTMSTGDQTFLPLLDRMRNWLKTDCLIDVQGTMGSMTLPAVVKKWAPGWTEGTSMHLMWPMMECMAYSSVIFNSNEDFRIAAGLFEVLTRFYQSPAQATVAFHNSSSWSAIAMRLTMFPGAESKIMANVLHWSFAYPLLFTRSLGIE